MKYVGAEILIANLLNNKDIGKGFNISSLYKLEEEIMHKHPYNGVWFFGTTSFEIDDVLYLYKDIFGKSQDMIYKKKDFNLDYFNKRCDKELIDIIKELCKDE